MKAYSTLTRLLMTLAFGLVGSLTSLSAADVTFTVDMNDYAGPADYLTEGVTVNGTFNNWCGACAPMSDGDADGIYELIIPLDPGEYEFKYAIGAFTDQEMLPEGSECTVSNFGFTNRSLVVGEDPIVFPVTCFGACVICDEVVITPTYEMTFAVDMNQYPGTIDYLSEGMNVNGTFNGWCGNCWALDDTDADGIYEGTFTVDSGAVEFLYTIGNWTEGEAFVGGEGCTNNPGGNWNRYVDLDSDLVLDPYCWNTCELCPAAMECPNPTAIICDNIDFYTLGVMNGQGAHWDTWSGTLGGPEDAIVSDEQAFSFPHSVLIQDGGSQDVLLRLGDQETGQWTLDWKMYIPVGNNGYYNFQGANVPGTVFIAEVYFNQTNDTPGEGTWAGFDFTYPEGVWFDVQHAIDLDTDAVVLSIDGAEIGIFPFTDTGGDLLSSVDFFSADATNNRYYIDDVIFDGEPSLSFDPCPAPAAVICDNVDDYTLGAMNGQGAHWDTWSGTLGGAEDAIVSNEQAFSNNQSVLIQEGGSQDVLLRLGDQSAGLWTVDWKMYIPVGNNGYYNFQGANNPGDAYIAEVYFNQTNGTPGEGTWAGTAFTYPEGVWFDVQHEIDLDTDAVVVTIDGTELGTFPYTVDGGDFLSSVDFFSADATNNRYFVDDVIFNGDPGAVDCPNLGAVICDNFDDYTLGAMNGQGVHWDTWSGTLGGAEDAIVSDEQAFSNTQSVLIADGGAQDVLLRLGNQETGLWILDWKMYVPVGNNGYYNFQGANTPGSAFIAEVYFNQTNSTPGEGTWAGTAFTYPEEEWFDVQHLIYLDADEIEVTINGTSVGTFPYTVAGGDLLSSVDFFSADADNNRYYIDDVVFDGAPNGLIEYAESSFTIYPNPTEDMLTISGEEQIDAVVVRNVLGAIVSQLDTPFSNIVTIDVADLTTGVYFVEVRVGDLINVSRVIKR